MSVHFASLKGSRDHNEDRHNIILGLTNPKDDIAPINFYGIYDGHGGKFVSKYLSNNMPQYFTKPDITYPLTPEFVNKVYDEIQNTLYSSYENKATECGSTCLIVCQFINNGKKYINVANVGDSRCVMCRSNIAIPLTRDHKPNWPDERARISKLGGQIQFDNHDWRINDLSVSRVYGDKASSKYVRSHPDLYKYQLRNTDKFLIMACDGLWDVCTPQEAVNFVIDNCYDVNMNRINKNVNIARKLAEHALNMESSDNVTIIVIFID